MKNEHQKPKFVAQSRPGLYVSQQLPSTCNQQNKGSTNIFVALHVDHARCKTWNIDLKLATKQCCATRWRFLYFVFWRLYSRVGRWPTDSLLHLPFVLAFSGFWYLVFRRLKLDISQWANFVIASEQTAIIAIVTILTSELKTFDVVLNTSLQKKWRAQNMTVFF